MRIVDVHISSRKEISIRVFLNGEEVGAKAWRALLPERPGRKGLGWADIYDFDDPLFTSKKKYGIIWYEPKE